MWNLYPRKPARVKGNTPNLLQLVEISPKRGPEDKENRKNLFLSISEGIFYDFLRFYKVNSSKIGKNYGKSRFFTGDL